MTSRPARFTQAVLRAGRLAALLLGAAVALCPAPARAWGALGHEVVAEIALERMGPEARALIKAAAGEIPLSDPAIATWADAHRTPRDGPWHYVNIPFGSVYQPARDCKGGDCVVAAIERERLDLARAKDPEARLVALRWLVHLVGDIHQPLHAGSPLDRGGNDQRVRVGKRNEPTNLHHVWDDEVVEALARGRRPRELARALLAGATPVQLKGWADLKDAMAWADESSHEAQAIYADLGIKPQGREILALSKERLDAQGPRAGEALLRAGVRLAALLDAVAARR
jgi:nuclease S1